MWVNCQEYPSMGYECDFTRSSINEVYRKFYEAIGQIEKPRCSITKSEYIDGYTIFGFNFIPDLSNSVSQSGYISVIREGNMSLHIRFKSPMLETVSAFLYLEFDNLIEIPESRIPIREFT